MLHIIDKPAVLLLCSLFWYRYNLLTWLLLLRREFESPHIVKLVDISPYGKCIYKRAGFIFISQKWKIKVLLRSTVPYFFYRESSGNNYLSAISDNNMPEQQNYFYFFSGERKWDKVKWNMKVGCIVSPFFKVLDVFLCY